MSNFEYIIKDGKCYLVFGKHRMKILWKERWVPKNTEIVVYPEKIELDISSITFDSFEGTATITPTVTPENSSGTLVWTSSNEDIAIVSSTGVVAPVAFSTTPEVNTAIITCSSSLDENIKATCTVKSTVIIPTAISLNETVKDFSSPGTFQLVATISPETAKKDVVWSLDDSYNDITIDQTGLITVTSVSSGATAIATCASKYNSNIKATCTIELTPEM